MLAPLTPVNVTNQDFQGLLTKAKLTEGVQIHLNEHKESDVKAPSIYFLQKSILILSKHASM